MDTKSAWWTRRVRGDHESFTCSPRNVRVHHEMFVFTTNCSCSPRSVPGTTTSGLLFSPGSVGLREATTTQLLPRRTDHSYYLRPGTPSKLGFTMFLGTRILTEGEPRGEPTHTWALFFFCSLASPPCAMVPESSIGLHFLPALDPLPVSENLELVF